ncbi:hypothetical protein N7462_009620 [Penicillium macrosclerotiorum]|uniref:uncharacterized protein n=1 Tax=Penicillium macrosclerotiorum TaxID=303699 RepID=UPI002546966D|nr:uncharacterized protein N7462_009620 [Penicillium macrosclerotiorum]KAJ5674181.1 hypothetical protein N7462_009620 [Penicillium macrosclerotiorum]
MEHTNGIYMLGNDHDGDAAWARTLLSSSSQPRENATRTLFAMDERNAGFHAFMPDIRNIRRGEMTDAGARSDE